MVGNPGHRDVRSGCGALLLKSEIRKHVDADRAPRCAKLTPFHFHGHVLALMCSSISPESTQQLLLIKKKNHTCIIIVAFSFLFFTCAMTRGTFGPTSLEKPWFLNKRLKISLVLNRPLVTVS